jgi:hypothetical protein
MTLWLCPVSLNAECPNKPFVQSVIMMNVVMLIVVALFSLTPYIESIIYLFNTTSYLNEEANCTEPSLSVSVPWSKFMI